MMTRILMGISTITLFFTLAPEAVEASPSRDGLITLTAQPWLSGGCQIGPRRSSGVLRSQRSLPRRSLRQRTIRRSQHRLAGVTFCIDGVKKRRLSCGMVQRWIPAHYQSRVQKVKIQGQCRPQVRYRSEYRCGVLVRTPYTVMVQAPDHWVKKKVRHYVRGAWSTEKGQRCRVRDCSHGGSFRH
ncbi:hypothetical protein OAU96_03550 [Planctomycetota bacterium]|nr:hypothetical protein [Planctomycetota bacterium]